MASNLIYVGTYTANIHTLRLDLATGALAEVAVVGSAGRPSYLAFHPTRDVLYAVNELREYAGQFGGAACGFAIDTHTGQLTPLNTVATHGADPCHLRVDPAGRHLIVANYTSGHVTVLPILGDGRLGPAAQVIAHAGASIHPTRQTGPHSHHIAFNTDGTRVFVAELGLDQIVVYRRDPVAGTLTPDGAPTTAAPGAGPRQIVLHPTASRAYVLNELAATITTHIYDPATGHLTPGASVSAVPPGFTGANSGAELRIAPSGRFLYSSNRGHDSIAIFAIAPGTGALTPRGHMSTGGATPRGFDISPDGKLLVAANQNSGNIVLFGIDTETGALLPTGQSIMIERPVCVRFADAPG